ncbi:MAG TPA: two-component regulator propeller domain-containing protein [Kofleriaceae bacterium]|nr:two-component regulator propeller domain-containing protein [Kofleriaceae bacterium]
MRGRVKPVGWAACAIVWGAVGVARASVTTVEIAPERVTLRRSLRFQILDREDGLPQNNVTSVVQDRTGFVWLGTQDGVARWDGHRVVVLRNDPEDPTSLSASFVKQLLVARDGTLWVGTEGGGVNRYRPDSATFDRFTAAPGRRDALQSGSVWAMSEGPDGRIWIGTGGGGLAALDPATGKVRSYGAEDGLPPFVFAVHADRDGTVWAGTSSGFYRLEPGRGGAVQALGEQEDLAEATITSLVRDREGDFWIGTDAGGLVRFAPATGRVTRYRKDPSDWRRLEDDSIRAVYQDREGRLWVVTNNALHLLVDAAAGRFERHHVEPGDPRGLPESPRGVFQDAAGVLWITTLSRGAALLDPRALRFATYKTASVLSALAMAGSDLWYTTFEHACRLRGVDVLEGVCYRVRRGLPVLVDRGGTVWVGTEGEGLYRLDPGAGDRWRLYRNDPGDPNSVAAGVMTRLHEDRAGTLWIAMVGAGLQRFDRREERFVAVDLPSSDILSVKDDPAEEGVLWIGTTDHGLLRYTVATGAYQAYVPRPGGENKTDNAVGDFLFDGEGTIWLATYGGGLKRLDRASGAFKTYRRAHGLPADDLYAVHRGADRMLWLSSIAGLIRFDPDSAAVHVFTRADGLQSDEFTLNAAIAMPGSRLAFGGVDGFNVFRPDQIDIDRHQAPVVVTSIDVLGEPYHGGRPAESIRRVSLDHDEASLTVGFAALSYSGSQLQRLEYRLVGASDRWLESESAVVGLAGLDDGTYRLLLRARNRHGIASDPIELTIVVAPPPWRTWWAYSLYGLAALGLLLAAYRTHRARIDRLQKLARLAAVEREFEVTAAVQAWFLPDDFTHSTGLCDLVGFYRAADKCSGDWWWYEDIGGGKLWVTVGDVTGHGSGPAMITAAVSMGMRVLPSSTEAELVERLDRLNAEVLQSCKRKATMSMTALVLDQESGEVAVYSLGGVPAFLLRPDGRHAVVGEPGNPLGSFETLGIGRQTARLAPGDRLVITTDGIIEATTPSGRQLGFRRFVQLLRDARAMPLDAAVAWVIEEVDRLRGGHAQEDDFTFCMVELRERGR